MALRLTGKFYSLDGEYIWIEIYDEDLVTPSSDTMDIASASLKREGGDGTAFSRVFTSSLDIEITNNNSAVQSLIDDISEMTDKKFFVKVKRNYVVAVPPDPLDTFDDAFNGILITDEVQLENTYNPRLKLSFVDGLSLIADNEYRPTESTYYDIDTYATVRDHLLNILNLNPAVDYHPNPILSTKIEYYDSIHSSVGAIGTFDTLDKTRISHHAFTKYDDSGNNLITKNIKDVMNSILVIFDARIYYDTNYGIYRVTQRHELSSDTLASFTYTKSGSQSTETGKDQMFTITTPGNELSTGSIFGFKPPLKKVILNYEYADKTGLFLPNWDSDTASVLVDCGSIKIVSNATRLAFKGNLYHNSALLPAQQWINHKLKFQLTIKLERVSDGQIYYYRSSDNSFVETASYYDIYTDTITEDSDNISITREIFFQTQRLIYAAGGAGDFDVDDIIQVWLLFEFDTAVPDTTGIMGHDWLIHGAEAYTNETPHNNDIRIIKEQYYGLVSENNNYIKEESTNLGDTVRVNTIERLEVTNGTDWFMSSDWALGALTGGNYIQELVILDMIRSQAKSIRTFEATVFGGQHKLGRGLTYDSSDWIPLDGMEDLKSSEVRHMYYEYKAYVVSSTLGLTDLYEGSSGSSGASSSGGSSIPVQSSMVFIPKKEVGSGTTLALDDLPNPDNFSDPDTDILPYIRVTVGGIDLPYQDTLTPYGYKITSGATEITFGRDITGEDVRILIIEF